MADQADQQVAVIEAVSGLLPRPSASFIMRSHHWRGTRVISRRSAKHEGQTGRILFCGRSRLTSRREKFIARGQEESAGREQRARSNIPQNFKFSRGRVRLSWKHMDTLYETLLHASTLIRNFIERNVSLPVKLIVPKIQSHLVAICQILIHTKG